MTLSAENLKLVVSQVLAVSDVPQNCIKRIVLDGVNIELVVKLGFVNPSLLSHLEATLKEAIASQFPGAQLNLKVGLKIERHQVQKSLKPLPGIKNIIAVASGKGGVGKSTTSVNLAYALKKSGAKVGILDADIYGPSLPLMVGVQEKAKVVEKKLQTITAHGIPIMSMGCLVEDKTAMIWRGPMATSAMMQLLQDCDWGTLDYLIIDLPPGTGDIQLTLMQKVPLSGAVVVTTPQDLALLDVKKSITMFEKVEVGILGIVENMSTHHCSQCGHEEPIFGHGGGNLLAENLSIPLLGEIPLDLSIRQGGDQGLPIVLQENSIGQAYLNMAQALSKTLSQKPVDYSAGIPNIVMEATSEGI